MRVLGGADASRPPRASRDTSPVCRVRAISRPDVALSCEGWVVKAGLVRARGRSASMVLCFGALCVALVLGPAGPAGAAPGGSGSGAGTDSAGEDAGGALTLRDALDVSARAYNEAKAVLDASKARQAEIDTRLRELELRLTVLRSQVGATANAAYRGSKFNLTAALLDKSSPENLLRGVTTVTYLAWRDDYQLREYTQATTDYAAQRKALEDEIRLQEEQTRQMEKRKNDAAKALAAAGGGGFVNGVPVPLPSARAAPRNPDGSWPKEGCTVDDPTTSGCITPRTAHALSESRLAGFTRFTGCYRPGDRWEHPKGRACDYSAAVSGFQGVNATGGDKAYGDRLAGWCVANASRLGVLYVIWYRMIWHPGLGWKSYSGGGDPAAAHTNHVHLSML